MKTSIKIVFVLVILFSTLLSRESMITNFHFHRLANGNVIVHSHFNSKKHNHTKKEIIVLDKYYTTISKTIEIYILPDVFIKLERVIYEYTYKSVLHSYTKFIYGHYP